MTESFSLWPRPEIEVRSPSWSDFIKMRCTPWRYDWLPIGS